MTLIQQTFQRGKRKKLAIFFANLPSLSSPIFSTSPLPINFWYKKRNNTHVTINLTCENLSSPSPSLLYRQRRQELLLYQNYPSHSFARWERARGAVGAGRCLSVQRARMQPSIPISLLVYTELYRLRSLFQIARPPEPG
jgi:hypothetical protein